MQSVPWHTHPFVSGVLVVSDATRVPLAREAADSFTKQDWPVKELIVVNTTGVFLGLGRELLFTVPPTSDRKELVRIGYCASGGEWCAVLDDNAWYAPEYLKTQMAQAVDGVRVMLTSGVFYFDTRQRATVRRWDMASYVFKRTAETQLPSEVTAEALRAAFKSVYIVDPHTEAPLVTRFLYANQSSD